MKRRTALGLPGILILSAGFAGLVSSCHSPDFTPEVTSVTINRSSLVMGVDLPFLDTYTLVVTLRPSVAWYGARIVWNTSDPAVVDFIGEPSSEFREDGRAAAEIVVFSYAEATAYIRAVVTSAEDRVFYVFCMIIVEERMPAPEQPDTGQPEEPSEESPPAA